MLTYFPHVTKRTDLTTYCRIRIGGPKFGHSNGRSGEWTYVHLADAVASTYLAHATITTRYYTDDGAYYYVWEAFGIPARPWPAEDGLVRVSFSGMGEIVVLGTFSS